MNNNLPTSKQYLKEKLNEQFIKRNKYPMEPEEWKEFCDDFGFIFKVMDDYKNLHHEGKTKNQDKGPSKNKRHNKHRNRSRKRKGILGSEIPQRSNE